MSHNKLFRKIMPLSINFFSRSVVSPDLLLLLLGLDLILLCRITADMRPYKNAIQVQEEGPITQ